MPCSNTEGKEVETAEEGGGQEARGGRGSHFDVIGEKVVELPRHENIGRVDLRQATIVSRSKERRGEGAGKGRAGQVEEEMVTWAKTGHRLYRSG